jgi:aminomethyltransferase
MAFAGGIAVTDVLATPFHARASAANRFNHWKLRNGWTLAADYGNAHDEVIAARLNCAAADISWRWRIAIEGRRAEEFLSRLVTRDPAKLAPGAAFKALWLNDHGGVRGAGVIARYGRESFRLISTAADHDWIARAAALFDVKVHDIGQEQGGLAIVGPYARHVLEAAGLDPTLGPSNFRKIFWRGLDVNLSGFGEHGGYELWCKSDDGSIVWDRIAKAGTGYAMKPAGLDAMDILDLEAGVPRPERDYEPAREGFGAEPSPFDLGLESLIDDDHKLFNGRAALQGIQKTKTRVGLEFDGETPMPHMPLLKGTEPVGRTWSSLYSPSLRGAIALAQVNLDATAPGTELVCGGQSARVCALPFLPVPDSIGE